MINVIGSILGGSGYDSHTRNLVNALSKITETRLTTNVPPELVRMLNDKEVEMIKKKPTKDEINLIITNPMFWRVNCTAKRNWVYLVWEGDKIPKSFIYECLNPEIEVILVPSEHTKKAVLNSTDNEYIWNKIKVVSHGVDLSLFYPKEKPIKFTFVANKGFRNMEDRGGIQYLLQAYIEEFTPEEQVELYLKINPAYGVPDINQIIGKIANGKPVPQIKIDTTMYDYKDLVKVYNQGHVFVSPTRAESFNIPCIEAMACGLPVITTDFGGQSDFCSMETGWMIPGKLEEIKHEISYEGIKWLTPSIPKLKEALRQAFEDPEQVKRLGNTALNTSKLYTWDETARKINELL